MTLAEVLRGLASAAHVAGRLIPGAAPYTPAIAAGLGLVGDLAAMGRDPVREVRRIRSVDAELDAIHARWRSTWAPPAEPDPYEDGGES